MTNTNTPADKSDWKVRFEEAYQSFDLEEVITKPGMLNIEHFISSEIIEKLIADIPDESQMPDPEGHYYKSGKTFKQQLTSKWL